MQGPPRKIIKDVMVDSGDLDLVNVPAHRKRQGDGWFALLGAEPQAKISDIRLVHDLAHESVVTCVCFSADERYFATGCNFTAQVFNASTGEKICVFDHSHPGMSGDMWIRSVCFSPDGNYLATGAEDGKVRIWNIATKAASMVFEGHRLEVYSVVYSPDGRQIISGSGDNTVRVWDLTNRTHNVLQDDTVEGTGGITSVAVSPDGKFIAAGTLEQGYWIIWNAETSRLFRKLSGHTEYVYSVDFTPDGKGLVTASLDKSLRYWDLSDLVLHDTISVLQEFTGHRDYVLSACISQDGSLLVSGSKDRRVHFWDMKTGSKELTLLGHRNSVIDVALSPRSNMLATASGDWTARVWHYHN